MIIDDLELRKIVHFWKQQMGLGTILSPSVHYFIEATIRLLEAEVERRRTG